MKKARRRIDVNLEELDRVLDGAREAPLSESDHGKLRDALHALAELLVRTRNTEKTSAVVGKQEDSQTGTQPDNNATPPPGHGRNGAEAFGAYLSQGPGQSGSAERALPGIAGSRHRPRRAGKQCRLWRRRGVSFHRLEQ